MTIRVLSFDFDGCLFNSEYRHSTDKDVVAANLPLLMSLKKDNVLYTKNYTLIGSARQSKEIDDVNSKKTGSCFQAIIKISTFLETTLSRFLLADIYGGLKHGMSFSNALDPTFPEDKHAKWMFDGTKVSILYAQMHKFAKQHPNEDIILDFFDDKGLEEECSILEWINTFYLKYPELIPPRVTLRLNHYDGTKVTLIDTLTGNENSFIDANYEQTVKDMAEITKAHPDGGDGEEAPLKISFYVSPEQLIHRKPYVGVKPSITEVSLFNKLNHLPDSYQKIWRNNTSPSKINKTRSLLEDYTKQNSFFGSLLGRLFTGHWNRHHVDEIQDLLKNKYESMDDLLFDLRAIKRRKGGSLDRRIEFIETIHASSQQYTL